MERILQTAAAVCVIALATACGDQKDKLPGGMSMSQEQPDSMQYADEYISDEVAEMGGTPPFRHNAQAVVSLKEDIEDIKSTARLAKFKSQYGQRYKEAIGDFSKVDDPAELSRLKKLQKEVNGAYISKCKELELPAYSVLESLAHVRKKLGQVRSKSDMNRFMDVFRPVLATLDYAHLQVNEKSKDAGKIRTEASRLKDDILAKKSQYGL